MAQRARLAEPARSERDCLLNIHFGENGPPRPQPWTPNSELRIKFGPEEFEAFIERNRPEGLQSDRKTVELLINGQQPLLTNFHLAYGKGGANNPEGLGGHTGKTAANKVKEHEEQPDPEEAEGLVNTDTVSIDKVEPESV